MLKHGEGYSDGAARKTGIYKADNKRYHEKKRDIQILKQPHKRHHAFFSGSVPR